MAQSSSVDDTQAFLNAMRLTYDSFDEFIQDFRAFQTETSSSFYVYNSETANQVKKRTGETLPPGCPYYLAKYCCVHRKRKRSEGIRFKNYNCKAFLVIKLDDLKYRITKWSVIHSHSFHVEKPAMYSRNRRLTAEQESEISSLIDSIQSYHGIKQYAYERFNRRLTNWDVQAMRKRHSKATERQQQEVVISAPNQQVFMSKQQQEQQEQQEQQNQQPQQKQQPPPPPPQQHKQQQQGQQQQPPSITIIKLTDDYANDTGNIDTIPVHSECTTKNNVEDKLVSDLPPKAQTYIPDICKPQCSTSVENHTDRVQQDSRVAIKKQKNKFRKALSKQLLQDLEFTLNNMHERHFLRQMKAINSLNVALGCWPELELFASVPSNNTIIGLSGSTSVTELLENSRTRERARSSSSLSSTSTTSASKNGAVINGVQSVRIQPGQLNTKRKPLMVLRETLDDDLRILSGPFQESPWF